MAKVDKKLREERKLELLKYLKEKRSDVGNFDVRKNWAYQGLYHCGSKPLDIVLNLDAKDRKIRFYCQSLYQMKKGERPDFDLWFASVVEKIRTELTACAAIESSESVTRKMNSLTGQGIVLNVWIKDVNWESLSPSDLQEVKKGYDYLLETLKKFKVFSWPHV